MADQIFDTVLDALLDCLAFLEMSDEDVVPPDVAGAVQDIVVERFDDLSSGDRLRLARLIQARVAGEVDLRRQNFFRTYPEDIGLTDEDEAADDGDVDVVDDDLADGPADNDAENRGQSGF